MTTTSQITISGAPCEELHAKVQAFAKNMGWRWFTKPYDLNMWGFRNAGKLGAWDDVLAIFYTNENGAQLAHLTIGTTDPGREGTALRSDGVAVLPDGSHDRLWKLGVHKLGKPGAHEAFVQARPVMVGRDAVIDGKPVGVGRSAAQGINSHAPWRDRLPEVGDASHGCQVPFSKAAHAERLRLGRKQVEYGHGGLYSYRLTPDRKLYTDVMSFL